MMMIPNYDDDDDDDFILLQLHIVLYVQWYMIT